MRRVFFVYDGGGRCGIVLDVNLAVSCSLYFAFPFGFSGFRVDALDDQVFFVRCGNEYSTIDEYR